MLTIDAPLLDGHRSSLLGPLTLVTAPVGSVVQLQDAKDHCRVTIEDENKLIQSYINTATVECEKLIDGHRQFLTATYDVDVWGWWDGPLQLPRPKLASVGSVKYYDTDGTQQTLASTYYTVRTPWRQPGTIERAPDQTWPSYQDDRNYPLTIRFTSGFGTSGSVPDEIKYAIKVLVANMYENRGCISTEAREAVANYLNVTHGWGSYS